MKRLLIAVLLLVCIFMFISCETTENLSAYSQNVAEKAQNLDKLLKIYYIDVGQGDSELVITPQGKTILIDGGSRNAYEAVQKFLESKNVKKIDVLIATHPHEDHIGGLIEIIKNYEIGQVYAPNAKSNTDTFRDFLQAIKDKGMKIKVAEAGVEIQVEDDISGKIISPGRKYKDLNNMSAVLHLTYKETSFIFMGDAEREAEEDISEYASADVIKIGHHGSSSSNSRKFIERVNPKIAVISCGKNNDYGHPHKETIKLLQDKKIKYYRTDQEGTVGISSNGTEIRLMR